MLHFTCQNMRAFYGPWLHGLGLRVCVVFHMVHQMGERGMGWWGVVSVLADLFWAVACLFLSRFSIFFKPLKILSLTFFIFITFFLYDFLTFKLRC